MNIEKDPRWIQFKAQFRNKTKADLIEYLLLAVEEIEQLKYNYNRDIKAMSSANANYLLGCRSVGGVTLPPGV